MKSAAVKRAQKSGRKCIARGTRWEDAAQRRCSSGMSKRCAQRVDHLRQLRELQESTGGFTGFVPFAFEPQTPVLAHIKRVSAIEELRNLAVSRIYLDNFDHITAYWVSIGLPLAQVSLSYGVDDLHGTIIEEKIFHMAGATTPAAADCRSVGECDPQRQVAHRCNVTAITAM